MDNQLVKTEKEKQQEEENKKFEDKLNKVKEELSKRQLYWDTVVNNLTKKLKEELKFAIELSGEAISQRQILLEERSQNYYTIYLSMPTIKQQEKKKLEHYHTKCNIKYNGGEKEKCIEADLAYMTAKIDLIQNYINFCTETVKNIDNIIYAIKNKVDFFNISRFE